MKKILLATTALSVFAAGSAFAAGPTVTLGGTADVQVGVASQDNAFENGVFDRGTHSRTDTTLNVKVDGRTDSGLGYGAFIELEADVNQDDDTAAQNNARRGFVYVESALGRVEAGPTNSASEALKVDAGSFARATGGINGDFYHYVDVDGDPTGTTTLPLVILPELPTAAFPGQVNANASNRVDLSTANKISYYSPRIAGLQAGVSFTPDLEERGTSTGFSGNAGTAASSIQDVWNLGLNYEGQYDAIGIEASATGEFGSSEVPANDDLEAYALGLAVNYMGFTVGGSWGDISEFGQVAASGIDADYWTLGTAYEFGPFAASVTYLESEVSNGAGAGLDTEFDNLSFGADYQLAPGLVPYVEVSFFDADINTAGTANNDGSIFLVGTELTF
jgi:predicted porin